MVFFVVCSFNNSNKVHMEEEDVYWPESYFDQVASVFSYSLPLRFNNGTEKRFPMSRGRGETMKGFFSRLSQSLPAGKFIIRVLIAPKNQKTRELTEADMSITIEDFVNKYEESATKLWVVLGDSASMGGRRRIASKSRRSRAKKSRAKRSRSTRGSRTKKRHM
jgi:hypothetical protein